MNDTPLRYWRTGAVAVVMAALGQMGAAAQRGAGEGRLWASRPSPFDVADTALHLETSARRHGMAVFARSLRGTQARIIVLESALGGTPVLMYHDVAASLELPLSVIVRSAADGRAEVLAGVVLDWPAMPHALALDLAELNDVVSDALRDGHPPEASPTWSLAVSEEREALRG
jgi:hypothetical protein